MKKKQKAELRSKSTPELKTEAENRRKEILKLRMEIRTAKVKNVSSLKNKMDELAVVMTILKEKKIMEELQK